MDLYPVHCLQLVTFTEDAEGLNLRWNNMALYAGHIQLGRDAGGHWKTCQESGNLSQLIFLEVQ